MATALVISGGGSKGAFAAGVVCENQKEYDYYYGTSTGALVVLLTAVGKYDLLEEICTTIDNGDI